jgi:tRNA pseudouridine55 synthase
MTYAGVGSFQPSMKIQQALDGFFNLNKPAGWTSHDVVNKVRRLFHIQKVGHAGTLDPSATGVLPICVGKGTKVVEYLLAADKEYRAVLRLGEETDTLDATGEVLRRSDVCVTEDGLRAVLEQFTGEIEQIPPMYSAIKMRGVPLYKTARAGQKLSIPPRRVTIRLLKMLSFEDRDVTVQAVCSKGTYIRSLSADIGRQLGCGAHLLQLQRLRSGPFRLEEAITLDELEGLVAKGCAESRLYPLDWVLSGIPTVRVSAQAAVKCCQGVPISWRDILELPKNFGRGEVVRIHDPEGKLVAVGRTMMDRGEAGSDQINALLKAEKVLI